MRSWSGGDLAGRAAGCVRRYRIIRTLAFGGMAQILLAEECARNGWWCSSGSCRITRPTPNSCSSSFTKGGSGSGCAIPTSSRPSRPGRSATLLHRARVSARPAGHRAVAPGGAGARRAAARRGGAHRRRRRARAAPRARRHRQRRRSRSASSTATSRRTTCSSAATAATKVLDFGIAKAASQLHQTRTGTIKGKFAYLAPEQIRGEAIDRRVDVFALGIVLHELLTLRPLFRGVNDAETLNRVLTLEVPPPERVRARRAGRARRGGAARAAARSRSAAAVGGGAGRFDRGGGDGRGHRRVARRRWPSCSIELCPAMRSTSARRCGRSRRRASRASRPETLNPPVTGPVVSVGRSESSRVTTTGPTLDVIEPTTEPAPPPEPVIELRHPKAVPALQLADAVVPAAARERNRAVAARAALVVSAAATLALLATHIGSCAARLGHAQAPVAVVKPVEKRLRLRQRLRKRVRQRQCQRERRRSRRRRWRARRRC